MNDETLIGVCCYEGDAHQVRQNMPYYRHHKRPIIVLSPDDSPVVARNPEIWHRQAGKRAYIGQPSLDRQIAHMKILLEYPFTFYLVHDADSVCLSPEIPAYVYREKVLWSNEVSDAMHDDKRAPDYDFPHLAFQPPYFMHRDVLRALVTIGPKVPANPETPFIDWAMMAWAHRGQIPHRSFLDGVTCPSTTPETLAAMCDGVQNRGAVFVHSIKTLSALKQVAYARLAWKKKNNKVVSNSRGNR